VRHDKPLPLLARSSAIANMSDVRTSTAGVLAGLLAGFHRLLLLRSD